MLVRQISERLTNRRVAVKLSDILKNIKAPSQSTAASMNLAYITRRFALFLLVVFVGVTGVFLLTRLAPGDPIEAKVLALEAQAGNTGGDIGPIVAAYREKFQLDGPLLVQYRTYLTNLLKGDMGYSLTNYPATVADKIAAALPYSIGLAVVTTVIAMLFGSLIGALIAWRKSFRLVQILMPVLMVTAAIPYFLLGLVLQFYLGLHWKIFPIAFAVDPGFLLGWNVETAWQLTKHAILPAGSVIVASTGFWGLGMRAMMVTNAGEDYMVLGDAKGLRETRLFFAYAVRNVLLPQTTGFALALSGIVGGLLLVEIVFNYPGVGLLLRNAIGESDYFMIQGITLITIFAIAVALFVMDLIYPLIDPRISYNK